jgi:hypothetical protein
MGVHDAVKNLFPPLRREARVEFLRTALTFLSVRDPFLRLLSAYRDKLTLEYQNTRQDGEIMAQDKRGPYQRFLHFNFGLLTRSVFIST